MKTKKCPLCFKEKNEKFTREHLPFKALYKNGGANNPIIIKICNSCNQYKSKLDQEILARFGKRIGLDEEAEKAIKSLKKSKVHIDKQRKILTIKEPTSLDELALFGARYSTDTGESIMNIANDKGEGGKVNIDILGLWLMEVIKGLYFFYSGNINENLRIDNNSSINKSYNINIDFELSKPDLYHKINQYCSIIFLRKNLYLPILILIQISHRDETKHFQIKKTIYENIEEKENDKKDIKLIEEKIDKNPFTILGKEKNINFFNLGSENLDPLAKYKNDGDTLGKVEK